ncbi:MAG TPA: heme NO-binding domain-containing protein [Polyangiaceae bacterium]|nr:heme NO-binding domain-containing protein [Polyangiaceae bacterium]
MHGMIFGRLKQFVEAQMGAEAWPALLAAAGIGDKIYLASSAYPDEEIVALVQAASAKTGLPIPGLLEAFGEYLVPAYLGMYGHLVKPDWRALDLIEHTEETIHKVVRVRNPGALPPVLHTTRISPTELRLEYASKRRLCPVARGIMKGVAAHYKERLDVTESACMLAGAPKCIMQVRAS